MTMYDEQQRFVNSLAADLSTFIQNVIFPESHWMASPNQLIFDGIYLKLSLLTRTPKSQQNGSDYGMNAIDKKNSVSVSLPYLGASETAFLGFFGLERCLTLHPVQNNSICSVFDTQNRKLFPSETAAKLLLSLFALAVSTAGFNEMPIFVFSAQQNIGAHQNLIISALGRCQGHIMRAAFFAGTIKPLSEGIFKIQPPLWLPNVKIKDKQEENLTEQVVNNIAVMIQQQQIQYGKNHALIINFQQISLQPVPFMSRYHLETTVQKNGISKQFRSNSLQKSLNNIQETESFDLKDFHQYIKKISASKSLGDQTQCLNQDIAQNIYFHFPDIQGKSIKQSIYNVSQYFHNFPTNYYSLSNSRSELQETNSSIQSCWSYFDSISDLNQSLGNAVESMCFHSIASFSVTEKTKQHIQQQILSQYDKININYVQSVLNAYFCNQNRNVKKLDMLIKQINDEEVEEDNVELLHILLQLYEILDEQYIGQTQQQYLMPVPIVSAFDVIFSVNFSTAPRGSFDEQEIDIHQSMLWAYNIALEQQNIFNKKSINLKKLPQLSRIAYQLLELSTGKALVTTGERNMDQIFLFKTINEYKNDINIQQYANMLNSALQFEKQLLNNSNQSMFSHYMLNNINNKIVFVAISNTNNQLQTLPGILRHCPPNCILCRLGIIFSQTTMVQATQIASGFQADLSTYLNTQQYLSNTKYFDVLNHSIIIQKLVQVDCCQHAIKQLEHNKFVYIPSTMDQTILLYEQINTNGINIIQNTRIYYYLQFYHAEFKRQFKDKQEYLSHICDFMKFLDDKLLGSEKYIQYTGKIEPQVSSILSKLNDLKRKCVLYPYDNAFIVSIYYWMVHQNIQQLSINDFKTQLKNNYDKTIKSNIQFIQDGIDPSYLQNKYIYLQKYLLSLIQQTDYDIKNDENGTFYNGNINKLHQNIPDQMYGCVISPQLEYYRIKIRPYYISVDCINEHNMESFFYHLFYNEHLVTNTKFISTFFRVSAKIAYEIINNLTVVEGDEREQIYNQICSFLKPLRWELVLNCIRQGQINNEPHRLYTQFGSFSVKNDMIIPGFQNLIAFGNLETVQYRQFK